MLLPHIRSLILSLPNILPGRLLRPSPPSAKVASSSRSGSIKRTIVTLLRRGMRMNRTLVWEETEGRRRRMTIEGQRSLLRELVPILSTPGLPILLRTMGSGAPSPSSSRHGSLHDLDEAQPLPFTPDVFCKTQLGQWLIPLVTVANRKAIRGLEGFGELQIPAYPHQALVSLPSNPSSGARIGDEP